MIFSSNNSNHEAWIFPLILGLYASKAYFYGYREARRINCFNSVITPFGFYRGRFASNMSRYSVSSDAPIYPWHNHVDYYFDEVFSFYRFEKGNSSIAVEHIYNMSHMPFYVGNHIGSLIGRYAFELNPFSSRDSQVNSNSDAEVSFLSKVIGIYDSVVFPFVLKVAFVCPSKFVNCLTTIMYLEQCRAQRHVFPSVSPGEDDSPFMTTPNIDNLLDEHPASTLFVVEAVLGRPLRDEPQVALAG